MYIERGNTIKDPTVILTPPVTPSCTDRTGFFDGRQRRVIFAINLKKKQSIFLNIGTWLSKVA